jgi:hypothetical protein
MTSMPLAELPALPLHEAGRYVAAAYVVLFALVLIYVAIMAIRLGRIESELGELLRMSEDTPEHSDEHTPGGAPPSGAPPVTGGRQAGRQDPQPETTPA